MLTWTEYGIHSAFKKKSHQLVALKIGVASALLLMAAEQQVHKMLLRASEARLIPLDHIYSILEQSPHKHVFSLFTEHSYLCHMLRGNNCILSVTEYF